MSRLNHSKRRPHGKRKTATVLQNRSDNKRLRSQAPPPERAAPKTEPAPLEGELMQPVPRIPKRLDTVAEWQREIARVYRAMRKGRMDKSDGTKLVWVADIGVKVAKYREEMAQFSERTRILEAILNERGQSLPALPAADDQEPTP